MKECQLHAPAALPLQKAPSVPIEQTGWSQESVSDVSNNLNDIEWILLSAMESFLCQYNENCHKYYIYKHTFNRNNYIWLCMKTCLLISTQMNGNMQLCWTTYFTNKIFLVTYVRRWGFLLNCTNLINHNTVYLSILTGVPLTIDFSHVTAQ
jgi:hypothetical protein